MADSIDCIVVGYNDTSFSELLESTEPSKEVSGGYRHLLVNSVPFQGRRTKYTDLLNHAIEQATGKRSQLHVAKLPNLGVCYLVNFLRRRDYYAEVINFYNDELGRFRDLLSQQPHCVAITTTFYYEPKPIQEIVAFVRRYSPTTKIIVGGPHVFNICSDHPPNVQDILLAEMGADVYVFDSQGEDTLARLCAAFRKASLDLATIPNLIYTIDGTTFSRTERQVEANDMNAEAVDWRLFSPTFLAPTVQTRTARSCAYKCAFCRYPVVAGPLNLTSLAVIESEMSYLHSIGITRILFIDDTFNIPLSRFKEICRMMIRRRFTFEWFSYFRCANADAEAFDLLAESGCKGVFLGIESGDDRVLRAMNKAATVEKYEKGIDALNKRHITSHASFIIGHPGESDKTAKNTLEFIERTGPTFYCLEAFFCDPKVPIASQASQFGLTGKAYAWKHNTMDWRRASELVEEGYRSIKNSVICPLYGFDLWSLAYFMGQGISFSQLNSFLKVAARMLPLCVTDERADAGFSDLVRIFREPRQTESLSYANSS